MKTLVAACCFYKTPSAHVDQLLKSASRFGIDVELVGIGEDDPRTESAKLRKFPAAIRHRAGYTHLLAIDAADVLFNASLSSLEQAYLSHEAPIVIAGEPNCWPGNSPLSGRGGPYPNLGVIFAERDAYFEAVDLIQSVQLPGQSDQLLWHIAKARGIVDYAVDDSRLARNNAEDFALPAIYHFPGNWETRPARIEKSTKQLMRPFDVRAVPTVVYTVDCSRHYRLEMRARMLLHSLGFSRVESFYGKPTDPYWIQIPKDWASILRSHEPPLLIVEDDIAPLAPLPTAIPTMADAYWLGGGIKGANPRPPVGEWQSHGMWHYQDVDETWIRISGMLYTHAVLWIDKATMLDAAEKLERTTTTIDVELSRHQHRWYTAGLRVPAFWQDDGHHEFETRLTSFRPLLETHAWQRRLQRRLPPHPLSPAAARRECDCR